LWALTQFDINCFGLADRTCETLRALERARYAPASLIRYPRVTCKNLDKWSSAWVRDVWIELDDKDVEMFVRCRSIADLVAEGACQVIKATEWTFKIDPNKGLALMVSELFRADLDGDGDEEILVFNLTYATHGTLRAGFVIVAEPRIDGLIYPIYLAAASPSE
jgi:hypothetical protein